MEDQNSASVKKVTADRSARQGKFKTKKILITVIVVVVLIIIVLPVALYIYNPSAKTTRSIFKVLPYPVAIVDGRHVVTTRTLLADTGAVRHFYESQDLGAVGLRVDFSTDEGEMRLKIKEKDVLDKIIEDVIIKEAVKERSFSVSMEKVQKDILALAREKGSIEIFEQSLKELYGWDMDQFRDKIVIPQLYLDELIDYYINEEENDSNSWKKIQEAEKKINDDSSNFCEVTAKYSESKSAESCGEVGWFEKKHLEPEIADVVFNMTPGKVSDVIKSSLGYHIVFLDETRNVEKEEVDVEEVKLKQIFIVNGGFLEWFKNEKKTHRVWVLMKDYKWNNEEALIEFRDSRLEINEKKLRIKSEGDPSF